MFASCALRVCTLVIKFTRFLAGTNINPFIPAQIHRSPTFFPVDAAHLSTYPHPQPSIYAFLSFCRALGHCSVLEIPVRRPASALTLTLSLLICCGATSGSCNTSNDQIGLSKAQIIGPAVAVVAVVAVAIIVPVEIHKSHHTVKGCIFSTPAGLELRTTDNKTYALSGTIADIAPGSTLRLHGNKQKHDKNATGDQVFIVQKMQRNYGPCQALAPAPATRP